MQRHSNAVYRRWHQNRQDCHYSRLCCPDRSPGIDVVLEVTGSSAAGIRHALLLCCESKKHAVMINVEADILAGPLLALKGRKKKRALFARWLMVISLL